MGLYDKIFGRSFKEQDVTYAGLVDKLNWDVNYALQFGHLGMPLRDGYAGTKASGALDLLLEENWARQTHDVLDIYANSSEQDAERALELRGQSESSGAAAFKCMHCGRVNS
jgi:hypothetical protein